MPLSLLLIEQHKNRLGDTLHDTALLEGGNSPTGKIIFSLYGPDDDQCSRGPIFVDEVDVTGVGEYESGLFTPTLPGTYRWIANYTGDDDNDAILNGPDEANESSDVGNPSRYGVNVAESSTVGLHDIPSWTADVANLGTRYVRIPLDASMDEPPYPEIRSFLEGCTNRGLIPLVVLTSGVAAVNMAVVQPRAPLTGTPPSNAYIDAYALQAGRIALDLAEIGVNHFELWNEPNNYTLADPQYLPRANFGALLVNASAAIEGQNGQAIIVSGGLLFTAQLTGTPSDGLRWLGADLSDPDGPGLYAWLQSQSVSPYPWSHLGIHTYYDGGLDETITTLGSAALDDIHGIQENPGTGIPADPSLIWLTEFGDPRVCDSQSACAVETPPLASDLAQADNLDIWYNMIEPKAFIAVMFWFSQHRVNPIVNQPTWFFGLLNDTVVLDPNEHWQAWSRLRGRILSAG